MRLEFSIETTLAGHKSETYMWFRAKILRNGISVIFCKKVFDSFGSAAYNPPPPTGCGASEWRRGLEGRSFGFGKVL